MMKHLLLFLVVLCTAALARADEPPESAAQEKPFVHPGLLHSRAELEYIREKIKSGQEPWKSAWERLQSSKRSRRRSRRRRSRERTTSMIGASSLDYKPSPLANVVRGAYTTIRTLAVPISPMTRWLPTRTHCSGG